jgi:hypothetical protein
MKSGSWASYQSALPFEARSGGEPDDDVKPGRHDQEPPAEVAVTWYQPVTFRDIDTGELHDDVAPVSRVFGAERWRWKHVKAWADAMERRWGKPVDIEDIF